jgi:glycosyltransferase involved in cell wall biosynthesis
MSELSTLTEGSLPTPARIYGLVSIIIPTYHRLPELREAITSCLAQTYADIEVIVVSDGPDSEARHALGNFDSRLRYMELATDSGPAEARNIGVRASRGEWIAFLDDDDSMLPRKIELQMQLADRRQPQKIVSCRTVYRRGMRDDVWPSRPMGRGEDLSDYILLRPSLLGRPGVLPVQALLIHYSLVEKVPLESHKDHEDWAWLFKLWHEAGVWVEFVWEPLVIYNIATEHISRSRRTNWRDSLDWALEHRDWLSRRAFNSFLSTKVALKAKRAGDLNGLRTVSGLIMNNRPRLLDVLFLAGITLLPRFVLHAAWKRSLHAGAGTANRQDTAPGISQ